MSILDDIRNSLADGGIYNSPDGKYSIIGGGDENTPGLPRVFAGAPRILVSGGGPANGVVPFEILSAFPLAQQGEQQYFAQQKATYEAGEGKAPTFGDAALAAGTAYLGGSGLLSGAFGGGMLGNVASGATLAAINGGNPIAGGIAGGVGGAMFGSGNPAGTGGGYDLGGDLGLSQSGNAYPYGMGPQGTGIGTGNPYMFAGEVQPGSLGTGTVNNLGGGYDLGGDTGLTQFNSAPVEVYPGAYDLGGDTGLTQPTGGGYDMVDVMGGTESAMANSPAGTASGLGMLQKLMAATGLSEKQLMGLGAAGISSLTSLYGASQIGKAASTAANIGAGAADRATALQREQYDQTRADLAPYRTAGTNALAQLTAGTAPGGQFTKSFGMSDFEQDPGYGFRMSEGLKALDRTAAARGNLLSGSTLKGAQRYGQDLGSQEYQNAFNRYQTNRSNLINPLQSLAGVGQTSTNQGIAAGQNFATNVGNLGMGAASNQADAGLAAARANQSAYGAIGNAFSNYLSPNPMNTFFQNQLNKNPVA